MTADPYSVNVEFGSYDIDVSYNTGDEVLTASQTITVDGYNDYAVDFCYTPVGIVVTVTSNLNNQNALKYSVVIDGQSYNAANLCTSPRTFDLSAGSVITFRPTSTPYAYSVYVDDVLVYGSDSGTYSYTVVSDCSILFHVTVKSTSA